MFICTDIFNVTCETSTYKCVLTTINKTHSQPLIPTGIPLQGLREGPKAILLHVLPSTRQERSLKSTFLYSSLLWCHWGSNLQPLCLMLTTEHWALKVKVTVPDSKYKTIQIRRSQQLLCTGKNSNISSDQKVMIKIKHFAQSLWIWITKTPTNLPTHQWV